MGYWGSVGYSGSLGYFGSVGYAGSAGSGYTGSASTAPGYTGSIGYTGSTSVANSTTQSFTGTGSQTAFTLSAAMSNQNNAIVTVNGLVQKPVTHYTISGTTLTFTSAPYLNASIEVRNIEFGSGVGSNIQTRTILTSGSGTYTTPSTVAWLRIRMVGGGAGGTAGGGGSVGSPGIDTTFGSFTAGGGLASPGQTAYGGGMGLLFLLKGEESGAVYGAFT